MFVNAFAVHIFPSSRFTGSLASFVRTRMDETADECRPAAKAESLPQPSNVHTWALLPPPFFKSVETSDKKHRRKNHMFIAPEGKRVAKMKSPFSTTSSVRNTATKSSGHDSAMPGLSGNPCIKVVQQPLLLLEKPIYPIF